MYGLLILKIPLALLLEDPATKFKPSDPPINRSDSLAMKVVAFAFLQRLNAASPMNLVSTLNRPGLLICSSHELG